MTLSVSSASLSKAERDASLAKCQNEGTLKLACLLGSTSRAWEIMDDESDDDDDWAEMETLKKDLSEMETLKKDLLPAVAQEILVLHAPLNLL